MKRRDFLLFPGVIAMACNQASAKVESPRIGFVHGGSRQENYSLLVVFRAGLSALGWTDGSNVSVLDRWAEERTEALPAIVKELIGSGAKILVTAGTPATLAATRDDATIPIVLVGVDDPVSRGLVETLMQPGGNVTGLSLSSIEVLPNGWSCCGSWSLACAALQSSSGTIPASIKNCKTFAVLLSAWGSRL